MTIFRAAVRTAALLAAATLAVSPVLAATRTAPIAIPLNTKPATQPAWTSAHDSWNDHRWHRYRHHRDGIDGGDVLAGILVIGGIAAIASAAGKSRDRRDYPQNDRRYDYRDDGRERDYRGGGFGEGRGAMDRAVDACAAEAARTGQVDEIFGVDKVGDVWRVKGDYRDGRGFSCSVDRNGKAYLGRGERIGNDGWDSRGGEDGSDDR